MKSSASIQVRAIAYVAFAAVMITGCGDTNMRESASNSNATVRLPGTANASANMAMDARLAPVALETDAHGGQLGKAGDRYAEITENPFLETLRAPLSTFSIDVDTASYANVRRFITDGQLPPKDAVRIEEMINYFDYEYPQPMGDVPFSVMTETASCPWNSQHQILKIGLQGKKVSLEQTPTANLVFLLDVSGSMNSPDKLPLLKSGLTMMVDQLKPNDRIAIVVYAGSSGLVLPSTPVSRKGDIIAALSGLEAGGSTNGGQGIELAYTVAANNFIPGGNNRVILATDGDFNVGAKSDDALVDLIEAKRKSGVFLSVLGFGRGNLNDSMMEKLSNKGNGHYAYIDSSDEARRALGTQVAGTLYTIAKDVKIQVEFNPAKVAGYRLIGYENRMLATEDFEDDKKDAGEIGAGHSVTALYEIVPAGVKVDNAGIELKYSEVREPKGAFTNEMATVKLRYKEPDQEVSKLLTIGVPDGSTDIEAASPNMKLAASVAQFGLLLRDSRYKGQAAFPSAASLARMAMGGDVQGSRGELLNLVERASKLTRNGRG